MYQLFNKFPAFLFFNKPFHFNCFAFVITTFKNGSQLPWSVLRSKRIEKFLVVMLIQALNVVTSITDVIFVVRL